MGCIYKIENQINGKVYIGKTTKSIEERFAEHKRNAKKKSSQAYDNYLYRAIRKYGVENFVVSIIEVCSDAELNDREIAWISIYHSNDSDYGYNMTYGGEGVLKYDRNEIISLWNDGLCVSAISEKTGMCKKGIRQVLNGCDTFSSQTNIERSKLYYGPIIKEPVSQYTLDGSYVCSYVNMTEAARKVHGASRKVIARCCDGLGMTSGGFQWRYQNDPPPGPLIDGNKRTRAVDCYSKTCEYIKTYDSIAEAGNETGADPKYITKCCKGDVFSAGGFIWKYHTSSESDLIRSDKSKKPVYQCDKDGIVLRRFDSIQEAAKNTPANEAGIRACCKGKHKTSGGFCWKSAS